MANIFLDTNAVIDLIDNRREIDQEQLARHEVYISTLSVHIICYVLGLKMPQEGLKEALSPFRFVDFSENLMSKAILGPTEDFEDNLQLHSATEAECQFFITQDQRLLKMAYFGQAKIIDSIPLP